jgi:hypothetical protein
MRALRIVVLSVACATLGARGLGVPAFGQAQHQDDLQPGVNTSALPPPPAAPVNSAPPVSAAPAAAASPSGRTLKPAASAPATPAGKGAHGGKAMDRIDLDTTQITGNKELPKVMYVVPWKHSDLGDLTGKPANSLVDEILQPLDRDVFNREERYYHTVAPQKSPADPQAGVPAQH